MVGIKCSSTHQHAVQLRFNGQIHKRKETYVTCIRLLVYLRFEFGKFTSYVFIWYCGQDFGCLTNNSQFRFRQTTELPANDVTWDSEGCWFTEKPVLEKGFQAKLGWINPKFCLFSWGKETESRIEHPKFLAGKYIWYNCHHFLGISYIYIYIIYIYILYICIYKHRT